MSTTTRSIASIINSLIETCKDGQEGFRSAADNVKTPDFKSLFTDLSMQRQQYAGELQRLLRDLGEEPETSGSVAGALHRGWIGLKTALMDKDEHAILAECERGEDSAVAAYREALEQDDLPVDVHHLVQQHSVGVKAAHDRVRDLRDRFQDK